MRFHNNNKKENMERVNQSIQSLHCIIDSVTAYMKTTSNEDVILQELESKLKNFLKHDFVWIDESDPNYLTKKQLTDAIIENFQNDKQNTTKRKFEWENNLIRLTSDFWDRTEIEFVLNSETSKFNLVKFYVQGYGYTSSQNTFRSDETINSTIDYTVKEVLDYILDKLE